MVKIGAAVRDGVQALEKKLKEKYGTKTKTWKNMKDVLDEGCHGRKKDRRDNLLALYTFVIETADLKCTKEVKQLIENIEMAEEKPTTKKAQGPQRSRAQA